MIDKLHYVVDCKTKKSINHHGKGILLVIVLSRISYTSFFRNKASDNRIPYMYLFVLLIKLIVFIITDNSIPAYGKFWFGKKVCIKVSRTRLYEYIISLKQLTISCNNQIKQISNLDNSLFVNLNILEDNGMKNEMNAPQKIVRKNYWLENFRLVESMIWIRDYPLFNSICVS